MAESQKGPGNLKQSLPKDAGGTPIHSADPTSLLTASGVLVAEPCVLDSLLIATDETNQVKVQLFDNASAGSGDRLAPDITVAGADLFGGLAGLGIRAADGVFAVVSSAGTAQVMGYFNK